MAKLTKKQKSLQGKVDSTKLYPLADALAIVTEWKTFRAPDFSAIKAALKAPVIFDGRNLYEPETMKELGFEYYPIGRRQGAKL